MTLRWLQNDFLSPECCLFVAGGPRVIPAVQKAVDIAREKGAFVVWVHYLSCKQSLFCFSKSAFRLDVRISNALKNVV